jgi:5-methyltetrahydropteroyltriglutamate--homocysteine methyltransferase
MPTDPPTTHYPSPTAHPVDRIFTTHTGSLPRPADLLPLLVETDPSAVDRDRLAERVRAAVQNAVHKQAAAGIDVVSDGEMGKPGFAHYITARLTGFAGQTPPSGGGGLGGETTEQPFAPRDLADFPEVARHLFAAGEDRPRPPMPVNDGPIAYVGGKQLAADLDNLAAAVAETPVAAAFLPAISPGCVAMLMGSTYFADRGDYLFALADALREEYRTVVARGFFLQVDCPDLALGRHVAFADAPLEDFRAAAALHVAALNHALDGIDPQRVRVHVCWGNYPGPHHHDVPLRDILDILYTVNAGALSVEGANPRHAHEWTVFAELPLPDDKVLIPGVIDSGTNYIEHPEVVAQRIERYAGVVGRERVIAGTDCGFGTMAGRSAVVAGVAYAKLASLAEGAALASSRLW